MNFVIAGMASVGDEDDRPAEPGHGYRSFMKVLKV